jgi:hypothetical protein
MFDYKKICKESKKSNIKINIYLSRNKLGLANICTLLSSIRKRVFSKKVADKLGGCFRSKRSFGSGALWQASDSLQLSKPQHSESMQSIKPS